MKRPHTLLLIVPGFAAIFAVAIGAGYFMGQTSFRLSPPPPGLAIPSVPTPGVPAPSDSNPAPAGAAPSPSPSASANQPGGEAPPGQPQDTQMMPSSSEPVGVVQREPTPPPARTPAPTSPGPTALPVIPSPPSRFHVQAGAFDDRDSAAALVKRLRDHGYAVTLVEGPPYRVWVGGYLDRATADRLVANLSQAGFEAALTPR